jgi:hypothetical protein
VSAIRDLVLLVGVLGCLWLTGPGRGGRAGAG